MENLRPKTPPEAIEALNRAYDELKGQKEIRLTTNEKGTILVVGEKTLYFALSTQEN